MKVIYTRETGGCDFTLETLETSKVIKTSNELIGKDSEGKLVHVSIDRVVKITD